MKSWHAYDEYLLPDHPAREPEYRLAIAMLLKAARDLRSPRANISTPVRTWFAENGHEVWCQVAGLNPAAVAERVLNGTLGDVLRPRRRKAVPGDGHSDGVPSGQPMS